MTSEEKWQLGLAAGAVTSFLLGFRRLAGAVVLYDGYRAYKQHSNTHAAFSAGIGGAFLLWPAWPDDVSAAIKGGSASPAKLPAPAPVVNPVSLTGKQNTGGDELFMGDWTLYDVSDTQTPAIAAAAKSLKPGQTAALVLGQPSAPPLVFKARVIPGGSPGRYIGQWVTEPPSSGPQFADFAWNHVLAIT